MENLQLAMSINDGIMRRVESYLVELRQEIEIQDKLENDFELDKFLQSWKDNVHVLLVPYFAITSMKSTQANKDLLIGMQIETLRERLTL